MTNDSWNNQAGWSSNTSDASVWNNFEDVEATTAKNDYVPAELQGHVQVVQMKTILSKKNNQRPIFICSFSTTADCTVNGEQVEVGTVYDWLAKADEDSYRRNIKRLVLALNPEADPRSFGKELMLAITGPEQPARGALFRIRTEQILTQKGHEFTKCHFFPAMG